MSFEKGSITLRVLKVPPFERDVIPRFEETLPPLDTIKDSKVYGWSPTFAAPGTKVTEAAIRGSLLGVSLVSAERRVPASLLKAEIRKEEEALKAAEGRAFLKSKERAEIRKNVRDRLLETAQLSFGSTEFLYDFLRDHVLTDAASITACDRAVLRLGSALAAMPPSGRLDTAIATTSAMPAVPMTPNLFAASLGIDTRGIAPTELAGPGGEFYAGREFLTWLWSLMAGVEAPDGVFRDYQPIVETPFTLVDDDSKVIVRGGDPKYREAFEALRQGKLLAKAKLTFVFDGEPYVCNLDADEFVFRGLELPPSEKGLLGDALFQDRAYKIENFVEHFYDLYEAWLNLRTNPARWAPTMAAMKSWVWR